MYYLALPRFTIFRNIFDYVYSGKLTPAVAENMASLLTRPITTDIHKQHLDIISRIRFALMFSYVQLIDHKMYLC